jgi:ribosomal protein L37AE/L43A
MSIEGKHSYRFGYLKSEKWQAVRLEALVREKAKCQICGEESISNDAHHVWYPKSIWDTTEMHLVVLCRSCHEFIHEMLPECKTDDEEKGRQHWVKFRNAILAWRQSKTALFKVYPEVPPDLGSPKNLRDAYLALKADYEQQTKLIEDYQKKLISKMVSGKPVIEAELPPETHEQQVETVLGLVAKWGMAFRKPASCGKK